MDREDLVRQIRRNCTVSDAHFWGYYSLCGLLMRYRDLYRSEHSLMPWDSIPQEKISLWIAEREKQWKELESEGLQALVIGGACYDPFDADGINGALRDTGLVYGSGYGVFRKPSFFLARLDARGERGDYTVYYAGNELCRDLSAAPAMLQGRCIFIRLDSVRILLWDKFLEWRSGKTDGMRERVFTQYGIEERNGMAEKGPPAAMEDMVRDAAELFVLHEMGEAFEDGDADEWLRMLADSCDSQCEFSLRAVKDLLADMSERGPLGTSIREKSRILLALFLAFFEGIRRELLPEIRSAFLQFESSGDWSVLEETRRTGYERAQQMRERAVKMWREQGGTKGISAVLKDMQKGRSSG